MRARNELISTLGFLERNLSLVKRYLGWEIVFLTYNIVNALTIGFIGVTQGKQFVMYLTIGALIWGFLSVLFHEISESVAWERWEGTIEYTFMAPIHRFTQLMGSCLFAIVYGLIRTVIILCCVALFLGLSLKHANLGAAFVVLVVSGLSFIGLGLVAAILPLMSTEKGAQATHIMEAVILLVSGVYYDVSVLPAWLRPLSAFSPATYSLRALRGALLEGKSLADLWPTVLLLLAIGALLIPIGMFAFSLAETYAKKTGKLKRNG
ncbi:MAG TPA: ABC transporter permease [Candidatus Edwardsbacteria bacterium]|nr:ABC transporter permease [Candidatus Edwardsbacteria bacterium]